MRFNERITLVNETDGYYDPIEGKHVAPETIKTTLPCNLSRMGVDRTNELFGQIDTVITVARLQHPYNGQVNNVFLNADAEQPDEAKQRYQVKRHSDDRKGVFYLEGVV